MAEMAEVKVNMDIWQKAIRLNQQADELNRFLVACRRAGICPVCGAPTGYRKVGSISPYGSTSISHCTKCDWSR